jgi:hypothetical protein
MDFIIKETRPASASRDRRQVDRLDPVQVVTQ